MLYLLKHILLLILLIFKLKCNNLFFNEIMILNASYMCLLYSRFVENHPIRILEDGPLISEAVLSQLLAHFFKFFITARLHLHQTRVEGRRLQHELRQADRRRQETTSHIRFLLSNYVLHIECIDLRMHDFAR
jgi:hypothetical protein